ncbi:hypothetical protein H0H93_007540 [Arthromyces matolae]|nr:hypothetical protein H0H93_007540 [Arthromyces matolae]
MDYLDVLIERADLCIIVGTSLTVQPAASYMYEVQDNGGKAAIFNLDPTELDEDADFLFRAAQIRRQQWPNVQNDVLGVRAIPFAILRKPEQIWPVPFNTTIDPWKERVARMISKNGNLDSGEEPLEVAPIILDNIKENAIPMSFINATSKKRTSSKKHIRVKIATRLKCAINLIVTRGCSVQEVDGKLQLVMNDKEAEEMSGKWASLGWTYVFFPTLHIYRMPYNEMIPLLRNSLRKLYDLSQAMEKEWALNALQPQKVLTKPSPRRGDGRYGTGTSSTTFPRNVQNRVSRPPPHRTYGTKAGRTDPFIGDYLERTSPFITEKTLSKEARKKDNLMSDRAAEEGTDRYEFAKYLKDAERYSTAKEQKRKIQNRLAISRFRKGPMVPEFIGFNDQPNPSYDPFIGPQSTPTPREIPRTESSRDGLIALFNNKARTLSQQSDTNGVTAEPSPSSNGYDPSSSFDPFGPLIGNSKDKSSTETTFDFDPFGPDVAFSPTPEPGDFDPFPDSTPTPMLATSIPDGFDSSASGPPPTSIHAASASNESDPLSPHRTPTQSPPPTSQSNVERMDHLIKAFDPFNSEDLSSSPAPNPQDGSSTALSSRQHRASSQGSIYRPVNDYYEWSNRMNRLDSVLDRKPLFLSWRVGRGRRRRRVASEVPQAKYESEGQRAWPS